MCHSLNRTRLLFIQYNSSELSMIYPLRQKFLAATENLHYVTTSKPNCILFICRETSFFNSKNKNWARKKNLIKTLTIECYMTSNQMLYWLTYTFELSIRRHATRKCVLKKYSSTHRWLTAIRLLMIRKLKTSTK